MRTFLFLFIIFLPCSVFPQEKTKEEGLTDPFSPWLPKKIIKRVEPEKLPETLQEETLDLEVEGLVWNSPLPQAIIEGEVYKIGDKIKNAEIIDITKEGVSLLYKGRIFIYGVRKRYKEVTP